MLTERDLRELLQFAATEPVLSVYLDTDPAQGNADAYRLRLRSMLKNVNLPDDEAAIESYFNTGYTWSGRSLAIFSCAGRDFLRVYPLAVSTCDMVMVDTKPAVKPLADLLDAYGGYGVVLVDKQGARLFFFHLGELREQEGTFGEEIRHTKRGGASSLPGGRSGTAGRTRAMDERVDRNMKEAVDFTVSFFEENRVRRILIGGTDENVAHFRGLLPKAWQSLVVGAFSMSMSASHSEVQEKAMLVGMQAEHSREKRLIESVITAAAKGTGGVVSLKDTLGAIHDGRVQTLLVTDGYRAPGLRCTGCGYLTITGGQKNCPFCGKPFERIPDAVELAIRAVMEKGGEVEVIHQGPSLDEAGKIGALLRY